MQKRKLQVFVSSTYQDLKEERQAAVEAILSAGHIPAGMELFAAGDQSQWEVIKDWISESDVYMLILGGRYGSIEPESGKSYTQLEYEFALNLGKPLFAVVIENNALEQKTRNEGTKVIEQNNYKEFQLFKEFVLSKTVRFWGDVKDIKLYIHETLNQFSKRENLIGWIPGDQGVNGVELAEEIPRLSKENDRLRNRVSELEAPNNIKINGVPIEDFIELLKNEKLEKSDLGSMDQKSLQLLKSLAGDGQINLMHFFRAIASKIDGVTAINISPVIRKLSVFRLVTLKKNIAEFTESGSVLFMFLMKQNMISSMPVNIEVPMPKFL